jgi:hypothetical protein
MENQAVAPGAIVPASSVNTFVDIRADYISVENIPKPLYRSGTGTRIDVDHPPAGFNKNQR